MQLQDGEYTVYIFIYKYIYCISSLCHLLASQELRNAHSEEIMGIRREEEMEMSEEDNEEEEEEDTPCKRLRTEDTGTHELVTSSILFPVCHLHTKA